MTSSPASRHNFDNRNATERACLKCGDPFMSEGAHNRVCKDCKKTKDWRAGVTAHRGGGRGYKPPASGAD